MQLIIFHFQKSGSIYSFTKRIELEYFSKCCDEPIVDLNNQDCPKCGISTSMEHHSGELGFYTKEKGKKDD